MSVAIGFAVEAAVGGLGAALNVKNIKDNLKAETAQINLQKAAEKDLFRRRLTEVALVSAGDISAVVGSVGAVVDGRSLQLAAINIAERGARQTSNDAFVTANKLNTMDRQILSAQAKAKAARINAAMSFLGSSAEIGSEVFRGIEAETELSTAGPSLPEPQAATSPVTQQLKAP
jgi:hypothetical protein